MAEIKYYCEKLPFWGSLNEQEKAFCVKSCVVKHFDRGQSLACCDTGCQGMIAPISGTVRASVISDEGREITLFTIAPGEICVLSASCVISQITFETSIVADEDVECLVMPASAYQTLKDGNIHVKCFSYELLTERFSQVMFVMQSILFRHFDARLAEYLLSRYEKTGKPELKMTQEEIARDVNSAREVVARMLKRFQTEGLCKVGRGNITLLDIEKLKRVTV